MVRSAAEVLAASRTSIVGRVPKLADRIPPGLVLRNFLQRVVEIRLRGLEALQELLLADAGLSP